MYNWYIRLIGLATVLALTVVVMGAWVRLTDAGLGCPDWPGCYGSLIVPDSAEAQAQANAAFPERPLETAKAWNEMIHRYAASTLGLAIMIAAILAWLNRRDPGQPVGVPLALLGIVIFQGLLGMWTVTLLLKPLIVMGHLLGGMTTLALCFWLMLNHLRRARIETANKRPIVGLALAALLVLVCQIALGGWTSSNYAALACPDLPTCQGQWWPEDADFAEAFVMWRGLGVDYEFGVLEAPARVAIHFAHRLGAMVTFLFLGFVAVHALRRRDDSAVRRAGQFVIVALIAQVAIGIGTVWYGLPLFLASAHNGVAAVLLLTVVNFNHTASLSKAVA